MSQNQCIIAVFNSFSNWVIELNEKKGPNQHLFASIAWNFKELQKEFAHRHFGFLQSCNELHSYTKIKTSKINENVYTKTEMPTIGIDSFDMHVYYMHRDVTFLMACINCWTHLSKLQLWHLVCCCFLLWCVSSHTEIVVEYFCNLYLLHSLVYLQWNKSTNDSHSLYDQWFWFTNLEHNNIKLYNVHTLWQRLKPFECTQSECEEWKKRRLNRAERSDRPQLMPKNTKPCN